MPHKRSEKVVRERSKKAAETSFSEQYKIIRNDIMRLREDIQKGYEMAKEMAEKKGLLGKFSKAK